MVNKKFWLGILVMVLVLGMMVLGCEKEPEEDLKNKGYTFEIAIKNTDNNSSRIITQIDFINGDKEDDPVLKTEMVNLLPYTTSEYYKVSGFTSVVSYNEERRYCGIKVYYSDDKIGFGYGYKKNNSKFTAEDLTITSPPYVAIYDDI